MNLVDTYLNSNGYDYYGNAAEDTLVFFVHDSNAPTVEPGVRSNEATTNLPDDTASEWANGLLKKTTAANTEAKAAVSVEDNDISQSVPTIAEIYTRQTDIKHSREAGFNA